jgi:hypothetical protein
MKVIITPDECLSILKKSKMDLQLLSGKYITENFSWSEFLRHQTELPIIDILKNIRKIANCLQFYKTVYLKDRLINITSGWRSLTYNKSIKGATRSLHLIGLAVDFNVVGMAPIEVRQILDRVHYGGMELNTPTWTHLDIRPIRLRFNP